MPGMLMDSSTSVLCTHGGQGSATAPSPRVRVAGTPIVTLTAPHAVAACPFNVSGGPVPCVTAQWTVGATRVRSLGAPVLLADAQAVCAPNGTPVTVVVTQTRVRGV